MVDKIGWKLYETVGIGIANPRCIKPRFPNDWAYLYWDILTLKRQIVLEYKHIDSTHIIISAPFNTYEYNHYYELKSGKEIKRV